MENFIVDPAIVNEIKDKLVSRNETIAAGESVTSGLIQAALSGAEMAAKFYQGGITAYNIGQKCRHLNIEPIHASGCNCVSARIADDIALNVCTLFSSDWGLGITGYASPVPESDGQVFAHYSVAYKGHIVLSNKVDTAQGETLNVQVLFVRKLFENFLQYIKHEL